MKKNNIKIVRKSKGKKTPKMRKKIGKFVEIKILWMKSFLENFNSWKVSTQWRKLILET